MTTIRVKADGSFNLTRVDGSKIRLTESDIGTLVRRRKPDATELRLADGSAALVLEDVVDILDACQVSEEKMT